MRGAKKYLVGLVSLLITSCGWFGGSKELLEYKALLEQSSLPEQNLQSTQNSPGAYIYLTRKMGDTYVEMKLDPARENVKIDLSPKKSEEASLITDAEAKVASVKLYVKVLETLNQINEKINRLSEKTRAISELQQKIDQLSNQTLSLQEDISELANATSVIPRIEARLDTLGNQTLSLQEEVSELANATSVIPKMEVRLEGLEARQIDLLKIQEDLANLKSKFVEQEQLVRKVNQLENLVVSLQKMKGEPNYKFLQTERQQLEEYIFYFDQSQKLFALEEYEKALEMVNKAIALFPDFVIAYKLKGSILYKMGKTEEAKNIWQKVIELDPNAEDVKQFIQKLERGEISSKSIKK